MTSASRTEAAADLAMVTDLTSPCHVCGIACSGVVLIWLLRAGVRHAIQVDRPTLEELFAALWRGEPRSGAMPALMRDYFEGTGWFGAEALPDGTPITYEAVAALLALADGAVLDEHARRICEALRGLAADAEATAAPLFIYYD